jgi:polar amino acid transport system permease protein
MAPIKRYPKNISKKISAANNIHVQHATKEQGVTVSQSIFPASWSRQRKSAVSIGLSILAMLLFIWGLAIPLQYLPKPIGPAAELFAEGAKATLQLTALAGPIGVVIGFLVALAKLSQWRVLRWVAEFYIWVLRGTPLLVQVLFAYNVLSQLPIFMVAALALSLNVGAYNAEAIRSGILAVHKGQIEAARSLGLGSLQTFWDVVLPQAARVALPPLVNNIVSLLKDSSLAYTIGVVELLNVAQQVQTQSYQPVPVFITLGAIYLLMTSIMTQISDALERQLDVERHS